MPASIRSLLAHNNGNIRVLEAHDHNSREIIRKVVSDDGQSFQGVWISGLTQTTCLGFPDTELISPLERASLMTGFNDNLQQNNCRPLCAAFDADSGGHVADIPALVALLASMGVSMIVIEDKSVCEPGKKVNSLKDTSGMQGQANMYDFAKIV
jgi:phosphoenolpyruvate phosphomutase